MLVERFLVGFGLVIAGGKGDKLRVWKGLGNRGCDGFGVEVIAGARHHEGGGLNGGKI